MVCLLSNTSFHSERRLTATEFITDAATNRNTVPTHTEMKSNEQGVEQQRPLRSLSAESWGGFTASPPFPRLLSVVVRSL